MTNKAIQVISFNSVLSFSSLSKIEKEVASWKSNFWVLPTMRSFFVRQVHSSPSCDHLSVWLISKQYSVETRKKVRLTRKRFLLYRNFRVFPADLATWQGACLDLVRAETVKISNVWVDDVRRTTTISAWFRFHRKSCFQKYMVEEDKTKFHFNIQWVTNEFLCRAGRSVGVRRILSMLSI